MKIIFAILAFPFVWVGMFLYRIVYYDIIDTIIHILTAISFTSALMLIVTLPFTVIIDIPVGFVATFAGAINVCKIIANAD